MNRLAARPAPTCCSTPTTRSTGGHGARRRWPRRRRSNRPILLSIGYAACHWCHVMAHESFESPEVAAVMNELFVNIKVDREERPDVDAIYMQALQVLGEHGRLAAHHVLHAGRRAVLGRHLLPDPARYGRPGFLDVLQRRGAGLPRQAAGGRDQPRRAARRPCSARRPTRPSSSAATAPPFPLDLLDQIAERLAEAVRSGLGRLRPGAEVPLALRLRAAVARLAAPVASQTRCATRSRSRSTACARAASTITSAAASRATRPTTSGWCRISRRCSTTTPS